MPADPANVEALFNDALGRATASERGAFLNEACGGDAALRARVEALLHAHDDNTDSFMGAGNPEPTVESPPGAERVGTVIGRYRLQQLIGEGGFGRVYVAEQEEPVRRKVALKIIKLGMDTRQVIARFEAERQALAIMEHPNIAKVLDAGATGTGRPYFVMELVRGVSITTYCDSNNVALRERLELFIQVCLAVQHAHQKGIIHRDIKPSNVLVAMADGRPTPRVIDFGIAKATDQRLTEKTVFTEFRQMVGTPQYMSPEQAEMAGIDIDTRSDVYSLGVLLYELLVGTTPLNPKELLSKAYGEMQRMIREAETPRPSTKLGTMGDAAGAIAAHRRTDPRKLGQMIKGELEWIVMRAIEKDRTRRFESASALAADLSRHLAGEPVLAAPPSRIYQLRKFVRRHRGPIAAAALVALAMVLGIAGTGVGMVRAQAAGRAAAARADGERRARETAEKRLGQIKKSNEILGSIFNDLNPDLEARDAKPLRLLLGERLDQAARQLQAEAVGDRIDTAKLQITLGESLLRLGFPDKAIPLFIQARAAYEAQFGPGQRDTLGSTNDLAAAYQAEGKLDLALPLFEQILKVQQADEHSLDADVINSMGNLAQAYHDAGRSDLSLPLSQQTLKLAAAKLGAGHPITLNSQHILASDYQASGRFDLAISMLEDRLQRTRAARGPDHRETAAATGDLAGAYSAAGRLDLALPMAQETLTLTKKKLGPDHPETLTAMSNLANTYRLAGQLDKALPLSEEALTLCTSKLGPDHPGTITAMNNLAVVYEQAGEFDRAVLLLEEALKLQRMRTGPAHPDTLNRINNLAAAYLRAGKRGLAIPMLEDSLKVAASELGPAHPLTLHCMNNLAEGYELAGKPDLAVPLLEKCWEQMKARQGPDHPGTLIAMGNLAGAYQSGGRLDLARPLLEEQLKLTKEKLGPEHPDTLVAMNNLATVYRDTGKLDLAVPLLEQQLKLSKERLGPEHPRTLVSMNNLGNVYRETGHIEQAIAMLEEALRLQKAKLGPEHPDTLVTMNSLGNAYRESGKGEQAIALLEESLKVQKATLGADHPQTFTTLTTLGAAYESVGKHDKSLPLFEEALQRSKARLGADHPDTITAMNNLAAVYLAIGKTELALPLLEDALARVRAKLGPEHPNTLIAMNNLASVYKSTRRIDLAVPLLVEALKAQKAKLGLRHPTTIKMQLNLGMMCLEAGRPDDAIPLFEELRDAVDSRSPMFMSLQLELAAAYDAAGQHAKSEALMRQLVAGIRQQFGDDDPQTAAVLARAVRNLLVQKKYDAAEPLCREALAIREKKEPQAWATFNTKSVLGEILMRQKKYAEAEPLLLAGYQGMKDRGQTIPAAAGDRLTEAVERLVEFYREQGNAEQARQWSETLPATRSAQSQPAP